MPFMTVRDRLFGFCLGFVSGCASTRECAAIRQLMLGNEVKIFEDDETCVDVFTEYSISFKMSGYVALLSDVRKI